MNQITGSSSVYKVSSRRSLLVSYASMGDWQTFSEILKVDEGRALAELVYRSLNRADPTVTRRAVRRLMRRQSDAIMAGLITLICALSIPPTPRGAPAEVSDKEADRNMKTVYRRLSTMYGWTAAEISDMSPVQVYQYQLGGKDGSGIVKMTGAEYKSFRARLGDMN